MVMSIKVKEAFFDKPAVVMAIGEKRAKALSRFGAFVQRRMRSSMRRRKKPAEAGQPPSAHVGLLKRIFFSFDRESDGVVVGPELINGKSDFLGDAQTVPELMEKGGTVTIKKARKYRAGKGKKARVVSIPAGAKIDYPDHPFAEPALEAEAPNFVGLFGE